MCGICRIHEVGMGCVTHSWLHPHAVKNNPAMFPFNLPCDLVTAVTGLLEMSFLQGLAFTQVTSACYKAKSVQGCREPVLVCRVQRRTPLDDSSWRLARTLGWLSQQPRPVTCCSMYCLTLQPLHVPGVGFHCHCWCQCLLVVTGQGHRDRYARLLDRVTAGDLNTLVQQA